jgi:hypothetical protein
MAKKLSNADIMWKMLKPQYVGIESRLKSNVSSATWKKYLKLSSGKKISIMDKLRAKGL